MIRPLEGIKVLDLSRALAGPYCSMMLADMGADIIKIEMPGRGDDSRAWGPPFVEGESAYFMSVNRNKKSITLNLKNERAIEIIHKLIIQSDVLLENFRPGTMEKFKLSYEDVKEINPKIIYCSISGFGQDGPYRLLPGMDQILQGMGGLMSITGKPEGPPMKVGVAVADIAGGMFAAYGIMVALFNRERTKIGQRIDLSLLDCQIAWLTYRAGSYFVSGEIPKPLGSGHPVIVPYQAFKAKDEYFNVAVGNDQLWEKFCRAIGLGKIKDDPKFSTNAMRVKNREKLINIIEKAVGSKKADKWLKLLTAEGVPCGPILNTEQIFRDPQVIHREMVKEITHQKAGKIKVTGVPIKFSETPGEVLTAPPTLGQHTIEILSNLGYDIKEIEKLYNDKVI
ncbi:MAG: CaiB/BaiF CoA transferase family protein [Promethearchaeota archaeon]|jgi:formyl-CoA transferase/CoA:oxalate CoA-transferase